MNIQVLTPEEVIFDGEVAAVTVPGFNGEFQMLNNHAAVVSTLVEGKVKLKSVISSLVQSRNISDEGDYKVFSIKGGTLEFSNNQGIILCD
ncbi:MAG: F0F1 ATP synthase subunit epsilon [Flavobacteriaceae bacterium]|jgi:F-type H+-transporting ATPase subunit epsilon|nr:F0F1 ATP synthase subunit epsilon [Flavobacteriaceae bacterium]